MLLPVVFKNDEFVLLDKPAGLNFHSEQQPGLVVLAERQLHQALYPVHRLDKMTSGLVIMAKTDQVARQFQQLFEQRLIEKYYLAISTHKPKKKQGWVKGDMVTSRRGSWRLTVNQTNPAVTQFISRAHRPSERFFLVKPHTGKTHQIRVALKSLGAPIAGDGRYQTLADAKQEDRGYLHAYGLRFSLQDHDYAFVLPPSSGQRFLASYAFLEENNWLAPWAHF
ncbi:TIGR01621 family pseudouridine synthase [Thiomicrospira sp. ALE5]|uniref:TIGR01621 family pseudouridine synthase n=1 Tax=Thiomicrospira sp. ALE5 TaxID=748650 RepID=UPI0008E62AE6|nr:TIGR01621 family pseudouridine synthase [Thiomicrospira sp. ALE5]SFR50494.1 tRNA pseudouridine32 synthase / 23S rRNA pseudouridine746 synthase [Thiomicrospira sp. ALE5]